MCTNAVIIWTMMTSVQVEIGLYYNGASGMMNMPPLDLFCYIVSCNVMCISKFPFLGVRWGATTKRIDFVHRNT
jgi:hypothetical protein